MLESITAVVCVVLGAGIALFSYRQGLKDKRKVENNVPLEKPKPVADDPVIDDLVSKMQAVFEYNPYAKEKKE